LHDTPRWLLSKNKVDEAREVFKKIYASNDVEDHISEIQKTIKDSTDHQKVKLQKWMFMPIFVGVGLMFVQICTGINTIIYYTPTIFNLAGFSDNISAIYATIGVGVVNFLMTFVAIAYIDKFGRKPLLYIGLTGMLISMFALSGSFLLGENGRWLAVASVIIYIASFAMSLGPICWIMVSEIMPLKIRGFAMSAATVSNFAFNFIVVLTFLPLLETLGNSATFMIFGLITLLSFFFVYFFVPETKGISLEKIEDNWHKGVSPRKF
jgi:sugar porter (SP) family MFS transporter